MGNNNNHQKNHLNRKGIGMNHAKNISLANSNIINDNSINNLEIKLHVVIETLIRIFRFESKIKELSNYEYVKNNESNCVIVSKYIIEKYKEIFQFKRLIEQFDNETILKYINIILSIEDNKKKDGKEVIEKKKYLSKIIVELNERDKASINKIKDNISLLTELNNELSDFKDRAKLNYKLIHSKKNKRKVFIDFEIINYDIFLLLFEQNIPPDYFLFAEYFISFDKILILIKEFGDCSSNIICEVGKYNKREQCINIEYLLDDEKILDSGYLKDKLKNIELSDIYQEISGTKTNNNEIEFIEYNFDLDNNNKNKIFNIDNKVNIIDNEIKLDVVIETLIRIFGIEKKIKELCNNKDNKNNDCRCVITSKNLINKYKEIFQFDYLKKLFDENEIILKHITNILSFEEIKNHYSKEEQIKQIKKENLSKIIDELNKENKNLIEKIKENYNLLSELNNEAKFNYKFVNSNGNKRKVLVDFEIIDYDIFRLLIELKISSDKFLFADYFISFDIVLFLIKVYENCLYNTICEVGKYNKNEQCINIEYLLDNEKIRDSTDFKNKLKYIKVYDIYQKISGANNDKKEIQFKEYNFDLDNNNLYNKKIKDDSRKKKKP